MTSYEKCCWEWADAYRQLANWDVSIFKLEDLNSDYDVVREMGNVLGIEVPKKEWRKWRNVPVDAYKWPVNFRLNPQQAKQFLRLAGDVQEKYYGSEL
jgi:hypothetical protein